MKLLQLAQVATLFVKLCASKQLKEHTISELLNSSDLPPQIKKCAI